MDRTGFPKGEGLPRTDRPDGGLADAEQVTSLALDLTWRVLTCRDDMKLAVVRETSPTTLVMRGATNHVAACQTALKEWLTDKAEHHLKIVAVFTPHWAI